MKIARIYERVSTSEQDLTRQADIEKTAIASGFYIGGLRANGTKTYVKITNYMILNIYTQNNSVTLLVGGN